MVLAGSRDDDIREMKPLDGIRVFWNVVSNAVKFTPAGGRVAVHLSVGRSGAEVEPAGSAKEALSALRRRPPDVLVCDIAMPGEDGYELLARVRALAAGYQVHLAKPVDAGELIAVVARMAARHRSGGAA